MMRIIAGILLGLGILALGAWVYGYVYVVSLACGFGNVSPCRIPPPWDLRGDDFTFMVATPGAVVLGLFGLSWLLWRR